MSEFAITFFDLETSGRSNDDEILQIAAKSEEKQFNVYITPTKYILPCVTQVNGMKNRNGHLFVHDKQVKTVPLKQAIALFRTFLLTSGRRNLLVAHNAIFDNRFLLLAFEKTGTTQSFENIIYGVTDTLPIFRKLLPESNKHKLEILASSYLDEPSTGNFHDGLYDVIVLQKLVEKFIPATELHQQSKSYKLLLRKKREAEIIKSVMQTLAPLKGIISDGMIEKLAKRGFDYKTLTHLYGCFGEDYVKNILWGENKNDRIITRKKTVDAILAHLQENAEY